MRIVAGRALKLVCVAGYRETRAEIVLYRESEGLLDVVGEIASGQGRIHHPALGVAVEAEFIDISDPGLGTQDLLVIRPMTVSVTPGRRPVSQTGKRRSAVRQEPDLPVGRVLPGAPNSPFDVRHFIPVREGLEPLPVCRSVLVVAAQAECLQARRVRRVVAVDLRIALVRILELYRLRCMIHHVMTGHAVLVLNLASHVVRHLAEIASRTHDLPALPLLLSVAGRASPASRRGPKAVYVQMAACAVRPVEVPLPAGSAPVPLVVVRLCMTRIAYVLRVVVIPIIEFGLIRESDDRRCMFLEFQRWLHCEVGDLQIRRYYNFHKLAVRGSIELILEMTMRIMAVDALHIIGEPLRSARAARMSAHQDGRIDRWLGAVTIETPIREIERGFSSGLVADDALQEGIFSQIMTMVTVIFVKAGHLQVWRLEDELGMHRQRCQRGEHDGEYRDVTIHEFHFAPLSDR